MSLNEFTNSELVEFKGSKKGIIVNIKRKATFDEIKSSIIDLFYKMWVFKWYTDFNVKR